MPLTSLEAMLCELSDEGLDCLRGALLTTLDLNNCRGSASGAGLAALKGMPLKTLNLDFCPSGCLSDAGLANLRLVLRMNYT